MIARRLLGDSGAVGHERLGLSPAASADEVRSTAIETIGHWREVTDDPLLGKEAREVAEGVIRSCEALAATST
jgi:hypothetical protein